MQKTAIHGLLRAVIGAIVAAPATPALAADRTWNNGAVTGYRNTTDANWSDTTWNHSNHDNATFVNTSATGSLTQPIIGGSLSADFDGIESGTYDLVLAGNPLSLANISVWGSVFGSNVNSIADAATQLLTLDNGSVSDTVIPSAENESVSVSLTGAPITDSRFFVRISAQ